MDIGRAARRYRCSSAWPAAASRAPCAADRGLRPPAPRARRRRCSRPRSWCACPPGRLILSNRISPSCLGEPILNVLAGKLPDLVLEPRRWSGRRTATGKRALPSRPSRHAAPSAPRPAPAAAPASHRRWSRISAASRGLRISQSLQADIGFLAGIFGGARHLRRGRSATALRPEPMHLLLGEAGIRRGAGRRVRPADARRGRRRARMTSGTDRRCS